MKVLHLISGADAGGAGTHVLGLLRELNTHGEARLLCLGDGPLARRAREGGLPCAVVRGGFSAALSEVRRAAAEGGWQLLHCHGSRANLTGALLKGRLGIPVITTVHSDHRLDYLGRPLAALGYGTLNALALRRMDALVCVSDAMAETYRRRGFENVYPIYNGVPPREDAPARDRAGWLADRGLAAPPEAVLVGAAARMDPVKDLDTLLRGFAAAAEKDGRLRLLLAGTGREEARLRALAEDLGLGDRAAFLGWVEDMDGFLSALDIFALTSRSETFPYVLLSAGQRGLAVVAAAVGGVPALVEDGVTGCRIPPGDAPALADALLRLAADAPGRAALGAALRERVDGRYTLAATGRRQREIYEEILKNRGT